MLIKTHRRWETENRFYETLVTTDLLGDRILLTRWGGKHNRMGGEQTKAVGDNNVKNKIAEIEIQRRRHRYLEVTKYEDLTNLTALG